LGWISGELTMASSSNEPIQKVVGEERAAALLGFSLEQLRRLCEQSGLGQRTEGRDSEQKLFTYEELYRLCRWVARPAV
jgi:hypothetical protein